MQKNVASQKLILFAFDATTGLPKPGDAANLTAYRSLDWGAVTVLGDTSATEMDATNAKGFYLFDLTQAETNANIALYSGKSSTANIVVVGRIETMTPSNFAVRVISSTGIGDANVVQRVGVIEPPRYVVTAISGSTPSTVRLPLATQFVPGDEIEVIQGTGVGQRVGSTDYNAASGDVTIFGLWPLSVPSTDSVCERHLGVGVPAAPGDVLAAFPLSGAGNVKADVEEVIEIDCRLNGSGTQNVGGP